MCDAVAPSEVFKPGERRGPHADSDDEVDSDDPSSRMRSATAMTNGKHARNIRGPSVKKDDDSDSDFDL